MECVACGSGKDVVDGHCHYCRSTGIRADPLPLPPVDRVDYYHFSPVAFRVGDILTPPELRSEQSEWSVLPAYRRDRVYVWEAKALSMMDMDPPWGPHLFRVHAIGPVEVDPESLLKFAPPISRYSRMVVAASVEEDVTGLYVP